jgi:glyoxylase-like metal-dependent hydrolase (beta-lactamase superfamily II)
MNYKLYQHYSLYGFSNSYIVGNDDTRKALIVDPGEFTVGMLNHIEKNGYGLTDILLTHSHIHHVRGIKTLMKVYEARLVAASARVLGMPCRVMKDGERFEAAGFAVEALSVPGHSPDSLVYCLEGLLFTGDAIHAGLPGKTLSTFNARLLADRVRTRLLELPDESVILPGHGPPSTLGCEKRCNIGLDEGWTDKVRATYDFFV